MTLKRVTLNDLVMLSFYVKICFCVDRFDHCLLRFRRQLSQNEQTYPILSATVRQGN